MGGVALSFGWELVLVLLAVFVIAEAVAVLVLARAIGLLYVRLGPAPGPLQSGDGIALYGEVPPVTGFDMRAGRPVTLDIRTGRWGLLFVSPTCGTCRELVRDAGRVDREAAWGARLLVVARGTHDQNHLFARLAPQLAVLSDPLGETSAAFRVESTPFGMLVIDGRVTAKGIVNHRDHLEALLEAEMTTSPENWVRVSPTTS